jgi:hypothetical protein
VTNDWLTESDGRRENVNALEFFRIRHTTLHGGVTNKLLLDRLTADQCRLRPHGVNSVAWLLWHVARCEDIGVNRLLVDRPQLFDEQEWGPRMGVPFRHYGTGMTDAEVTELSNTIDLSALREYWNLVGRRTVEVISTLNEGDLDPIIDTAHLRRVLFDEGVLGPNAGWIWENGTYTNKTKGEIGLGHLALTHSYGHLYEARVVCGLLGLPGTG